MKPLLTQAAGTGPMHHPSFTYTIQMVPWWGVSGAQAFYGPSAER